MDQKKVVLTGREETNEVQFSPSKVKAKELQEDLSREGLASDDVFIDECDQFNIEDDEEVARKGRAPDTTGLSKTVSETGSIFIEKQRLQGVTGAKLEPDVEEYAHFVTFRSQEDNALCSKNNYCLKADEFQDFSCSSCKQNFSSKYKLIMHVFTHIDGVQPPVHICTWCGEVFLTYDSLNNHCVMQSGSSQKECEHNIASIESCSLQYSEGPDHNLNRCTSDVREKSLSYPADLQRYPAAHSSETQHAPDVSGESSTLSAVPMKKQLRSTGDKPYKCIICRKSFIQSSSLEKHALTHTADKLHRCDVCGKSFAKSSHLKKHAFTHTKEERNQCDVCGQHFRKSYDLTMHALKHTGERSYKCEVCGKHYSTPNDLTKHLVRHKTERPHKCHICGKSFGTYSKLSQHTKISHSGVKRYLCEVCGKLFAQSGAFKQHTFVHTGEKPYQCSVCGKAFTSSSHLKTHSIKHTGERDQ